MQNSHLALQSQNATKVSETQSNNEAVAGAAPRRSSTNRATGKVQAPRSGKKESGDRDKRSRGSKSRSDKKPPAALVYPKLPEVYEFRRQQVPSKRHRSYNQGTYETIGGAIFSAMDTVTHGWVSKRVAGNIGKQNFDEVFDLFDDDGDGKRRLHFREEDGHLAEWQAGERFAKNTAAHGLVTGFGNCKLWEEGKIVTILLEVEAEFKRDNMSHGYCLIKFRAVNYRVATGTINDGTQNLPTDFKDDLVALMPAIYHTIGQWHPLAAECFCANHPCSGCANCGTACTATGPPNGTGASNSDASSREHEQAVEGTPHKQEIQQERAYRRSTRA